MKTYKIEYQAYLPHPDTNRFGESVLTSKIDTVLVDGTSAEDAEKRFLAGCHAKVVDVYQARG